MQINLHSTARVILSNLGSLLAITTEPVSSLSTYSVTAISSVTSELVNSHESKSSTEDSLAKNLADAADAMVLSMKGKGPDELNPNEILEDCLLAIRQVDPELLHSLLARDKNNIEELFPFEFLDNDKRLWAQRIISAAIDAWHKNLTPNPQTLNAFRKILEKNQCRIENLSTQGLDIGNDAIQNISDQAPSQLFNPKHRVTPFLGRDEIFNQILDWCETDNDFSAHALSAPGGTGKTRLAIELIRELNTNGWLAGFAKEGHSLDGLLTSTSAKKIFITLDYADYRSSDLENLISVVRRLVNTGNKHVRILMLARPDNSWWEKVDNLLEDNFYSHYQENQPKNQTLPTLETDNIELSQIFKSRLAKVMETTLPNSSFIPSLPKNSTPLTWMMAAYLQFHGSNEKKTSVEQLCRAMVFTHERKYIENKLTNKIYLNATLQYLSLITFSGGIYDADTSRRLVDNIPQLSDVDTPTKDHIFEVIHSIYPLNDGVNSLQPDLLGEYLCTRTLDKPLITAFLHWIRENIVSQKEHSSSKGEMLYSLLNAENIADRTIQSFPQSPIKGILSNSLKELEGKVLDDFASADSRGIPHLNKTSLKLCRLAVESPTTNMLTRANRLNDLSIELSRNSLLDDAIEVSQKAITIYNAYIRTAKGQKKRIAKEKLANCRLSFTNRLIEKIYKDPQKKNKIKKKLLLECKKNSDYFSKLKKVTTELFTSRIRATLCYSVAEQYNNNDSRSYELILLAEALHRHLLKMEEKSIEFDPLAEILTRKGNYFYHIGKFPSALQAHKDTLNLRKSRLRNGDSTEPARLLIALYEFCRIADTAGLDTEIVDEADSCIDALESPTLYAKPFQQIAEAKTLRSKYRAQRK